jgi:hypothetical protein
MHFTAKIFILFSCLIANRIFAKDTRRKNDILSKLQNDLDIFSSDNNKELLLALVDQSMPKRAEVLDNHEHGYDKRQYNLETLSTPTASPMEEPEPSYVPTAAPTEESPTNPPTREPTEEVPSLHPTLSPIEESGMPTREPTEETPSARPSPAPVEESPTLSPTEESPSGLPTLAPNEDTAEPSHKPSFAPSGPSPAPTAAPSGPTFDPTAVPSGPTFDPTAAPSGPTPSPFVSSSPTVKSLPTRSPTAMPSMRPSLGPGETHSPSVSFNPTASPTLAPVIVMLDSLQPMDGVTSSDFNSDPSTSTAFCETVSGLLNVSYAVDCDIKNVANARRRLLDRVALPSKSQRMLQTPSIVIDYSLAFSIPNDGATADAIANALAETAKNNLVNGVTSGAFNAAFQAQLAAFGITNPALLTASSTSVTTIVLVIIATYSPTPAPSLAPTTAAGASSNNKDENIYTTGGFIALWVIIGVIVVGGLAFFAYYLLSRRNQQFKPQAQYNESGVSLGTIGVDIKGTTAGEAPTDNMKDSAKSTSGKPRGMRSIVKDLRTSFALYDSYDPPQA